MSGGCQAVSLFLGINMGVCGATPAIPYRRACVHEHIRDGLLCAEHAQDIASSACATCWDLPDGQSHDCRIVIKPLSEAV